MPIEYQRDGDEAFIGLNSRDNPASLPKGTVSKSQNFRLDRGVATVRKGLQRKTSNAISGQQIYGIGVYMDTSGQEIFIIVVTDGIYTYNPNTQTFSSKFSFPLGETITTITGCDVVVATGKAYILRGHDKRPLVFDLTSTISVLPTSGTGAEFPNGSQILYYTNRLIVAGHSHNDPTNPYSYNDSSRDTICVSNYLDFDHWDEVDVFRFNSGSNDEITSVAPWTLNEFIVFMRNSIHYVNVGSGRYAVGDGLGSTASMNTLVSDIGCCAQRSVVQANGGIVFLSENGVYFLKPQEVGSNESVRLLTNADPLSKDIDDVIQRINKQYVQNAVGVYWNNRYYLAVPVNSEDGVTIATQNNTVLIYNFILKAWESVDTYPTGFDVFAFAVAKKDNQRRLFAFDSTDGVFLMEELNWDEYGEATGTPKLAYRGVGAVPQYGFDLPASGVLLSSTAGTPNQIDAQLTTRRYIFETLREKRFATLESDLYNYTGSSLDTYALATNSDTNTLIDSFISGNNNDYTRRNPIRKIGSGLQLTFKSKSNRCSIKTINVTATPLGKTNKNSK